MNLDAIQTECRAAGDALTRAHIRDLHHAQLAVYHARHPYEVSLRLKGKGDTWYAWGHFSSIERAYLAVDDALKPLTPVYKPHGLDCVGFRVLNTTTGEIVERPEKARAA